MNSEMKFKCDELPMFVFFKEIERKLMSKLNYDFEYDLDIDIEDKAPVFIIEDPHHEFPTIYIKVSGVTNISFNVEFSREIPDEYKKDFLYSILSKEWKYLYFSVDKYGDVRGWDVSADYHMYLPLGEGKNIEYAAESVYAMLYEFAEEAKECEEFMKEWLDEIIEG